MARGPASSGLFQVLADRPFYVRSLGHRCLDFGGEAFWAVGAPVFVYDCNGSVAQQVRIKEIDAASHDVELRVRDRFCLGVRGGQVIPGQPLELQRCDGSPAQRFATDGDAILMGTQAAGRVSREYVIEPEQGRTPNRTPLVVGPRDLSDAEYFRFQAVDGSDSRPTSGFVRASNEATLGLALSKGWGTVIEVGDLVFRGTRRINAGVTLRGYRKFTDQGPEIAFYPQGVPGPAGLPDRAEQRAGHRAPPARAGRFRQAEPVRERHQGDRRPRRAGAPRPPGHQLLDGLGHRGEPTSITALERFAPTPGQRSFRESRSPGPWATSSITTTITAW